MAVRYCGKCGVQLQDSETFCARCGTPAPAPAPAQGASQANAGKYIDPATGRYTPPGQVYYTPPAQDVPAPPARNAYNYAPGYQPSPAAPQPARREKSGAKTGLLIAGIGAGVLALVAVVVIALSGGSLGGGETGPGVASPRPGGLFTTTLSDDKLPEVTYSYLTRQKSVEVDFTASSTIYPNLYSTMDSVVNLTATCEGGSTDALVRVEIPGFTQPYEQKVTLSSQITKLYIKPALLPGYIDLTSSKDAQISISVVDNDTGKVYVQDTRKVKLMSVFDFRLWEDEFGEYNKYNVLAWLTPESEGILQLRRTAISWLEDYSGGQLDSLAGYQLALFGEDEYYLNVIWQVIGMQAAMSEMGMRYNMGSFSMTEGANQRVLLPDDCLMSGSGVCIETALIIASAIQSANMHAMIIFPPGHAQVAIEDWDQSGDYWLIETTTLPFYGRDEDIDSLVMYLEDDEWLQYLADPWGDGSGPCFVVDCDMATPLGITGFSN